MVKYYKYLVGALALLAPACDYNDDNFEGLDDMVKEAQKKVQSNEYTLTEADYKSLAKNELSYLATTNAFKTQDDAQTALKSFVASKYKHQDKGSSVVVYYNLMEDDETVNALGGIKSAALAADDYSSVWKKGEKADYLTPATIASLPSLIKASASFAEAASGDIVVVEYKFSEVEPVVSDDVQAPTCNWTKLSVTGIPEGSNWTYARLEDVDLSAYAGSKIRIGLRYTSTDKVAGTVEAANMQVTDPNDKYKAPAAFAKQSDGSFKLATSIKAGNSYIFATNVDGTYIPFGRLKDESKTYGYMTGDAINVTDGVIAAADSSVYVIAVAKAGDNFSFKRTVDGKYIYMSGTYNSFNIADALPETGGEWAYTYRGEGTFNICNVSNSKFLRYDAGFSSYGAYAGKYLSHTLKSAPEGFIIKEVKAAEGLESVWTYDKVYGAKASAYANGAALESESWLISSEIDLSEATTPVLTLDIAANNFTKNDAVASDYFGIYVSTDYADDADFVIGGNKALKAASQTENVYALYQFDGSAWKAFNSAIVLSPADYTAMGAKYPNFSSSMLPADYLPKYLANKYPYAVEEDEVIVAYNYYDSSSKETTVQAQKYTFTNGAWTLASSAVASSQFVNSADGWIYNPAVVIELPADRSNETAKAFYQAATDWVWDNVDTKLGFTTKGQGYVTSYANNEYYTGSSAYYNNVDWRVSKAKEQYAAGFADMTDEQIAEQMKKNLIEVWGNVLSQFYPDANTIDGTDVTYTINFIAYDGANHNYTIVYKVVGKGQFEYVENSLAEQ